MQAPSIAPLLPNTMQASPLVGHSVRLGLSGHGSGLIVMGGSSHSPQLKTPSAHVQVMVPIPLQVAVQSVVHATPAAQSCGGGRLSGRGLRPSG